MEKFNYDFGKNRISTKEYFRRVEGLENSHAEADDDYSYKVTYVVDKDCFNRITERLFCIKPAKRDIYYCYRFTIDDLNEIYDCGYTPVFFPDGELANYIYLQDVCGKKLDMWGFIEE